MTKEEFLDSWCNTRCRDCQNYSPCADMTNHESRCKRLDHKTIQFAVPWFKSYDCDGCICSDFKPNEWEKWLFANWQPDFTKPTESDMDKLIGLTINGDKSVRYYVTRRDFYNNTFRNADGTLKWKEKKYYKIDRKSPIGYRLITEKNGEYNG